MIFYVVEIEIKVGIRIILFILRINSIYTNYLLIFTSSLLYDLSDLSVSHITL